jgi:hypothetical protein
MWFCRGSARRAWTTENKISGGGRKAEAGEAIRKIMRRCAGVERGDDILLTLVPKKSRV